MCSSYEPRDNDKQQRQIAEAVLGRRLQDTKSEIAAAAGVELERAEQLWQAMGFAHVDDDDLVTVLDEFPGHHRPHAPVPADDEVPVQPADAW